MNDTIRKTLLAAGTTMMIAAAGSVAAAAETGVDQIVSEHSTAVSVRSLNLSNRDDVERLYQRIEAAARASCHKARPRYGRMQPGREKACIESAVGRAVNDLDMASLSALHRGTEGALAAR